MGSGKEDQCGLVNSCEAKGYVLSIPLAYFNAEILSCTGREDTSALSRLALGPL